MGHKGGGGEGAARQGGTGGGEFCAWWPQHCPPPHAAFRTRCTPTVQRVRSEEHYTAAVPRLARPASGGGPGKTGKEPLCLPPTPGPAARGHHPSFASERTLFFVLKNVRDAACEGACPRADAKSITPVGMDRAEHFIQSRPFLCPGGAGVWAALRGVAASLSAAARGVSDTLHSHRAACSLRGALRGGSAASGSAGIGRRAGESRPERRPALPRRPLRPVFSPAFPRAAPASPR